MILDALMVCSLPSVLARLYSPSFTLMELEKGRNVTYFTATDIAVVRKLPITVGLNSIFMLGSFLVLQQILGIYAQILFPVLVVNL